MENRGIKRKFNSEWNNDDSFDDDSVSDEDTSFSEYSKIIDYSKYIPRNADDILNEIVMRKCNRPEVPTFDIDDAIEVSITLYYYYK
jgi:hypothetical protein